jgi:hypothetical protein
LEPFRLSQIDSGMALFLLFVFVVPSLACVLDFCFLFSPFVLEEEEEEEVTEAKTLLF